MRLIRACVVSCVFVVGLYGSQMESMNESKVDSKGFGLRTFGDVAQFLPAASVAYVTFLRDFVGAREQIISYVAVVASTYAIKYSLHFVAPSSPMIQNLSKRPDGENFEGFPSGHTASAFAAVGFLQKRYGIRFGLPAAMVASVVGISRIHAQRHTMVQVICGGVLGFFLSFMLASRRDDRYTGGIKGGRSKDKTRLQTTLCECAMIAFMVV